MKDNKKIKERAYDFAIKIINLVKKLPKDTRGFVLGRQLIRSGTSIGANIEEATGAFSKDDFIFKMNIAFKEARETNYWLRLIKDSEMLKSIEIGDALNESEDIKNILSAIVKTSKERRKENEVKI
ncbi:MAG: four helix bundle protein [Nitrospinae bacterium]|nr:four helix bundle protein [Nitrospinota bacterium]MBI3814041.1 four helix bundle protein [Nitrospinota bacterium]